MKLSRYALFGALAAAMFVATGPPAAASNQTGLSPFKVADAGPKACYLSDDMLVAAILPEGDLGISGQVLGLHEGWLVPPLIARNFSDEHHGTPKPVEPIDLHPVLPWAPEVAAAPPSLFEGWHLANRFPFGWDDELIVKAEGNGGLTHEGENWG